METGSTNLLVTPVLIRNDPQARANARVAAAAAANLQSVLFRLPNELLVRIAREVDLLSRPAFALSCRHLLLLLDDASTILTISDRICDLYGFQLMVGTQYPFLRPILEGEIEVEDVNQLTNLQFPVPAPFLNLKGTRMLVSKIIILADKLETRRIAHEIGNDLLPDLDQDPGQQRAVKARNRKLEADMRVYNGCRVFYDAKQGTSVLTVIEQGAVDEQATTRPST